MKTTVNINKEITEPESFPMADMKPCEVCVGVDDELDAKLDQFVSEAYTDANVRRVSRKVHRLRKGEKITLTFEGE